MPWTTLQQGFRPPRPLRGAHAQTLMASLGRRGRTARLQTALAREATEVRLTSSDGVVLQAWLNAGSRPAPLVVLIHGWLGCAESGYLVSAASELVAAGYRVARLNLRDHGATAHLNVELFHSARTLEVVDAVRALGARYGEHGLGVMGYSLGGNFALRVARALHVPTVAVCPPVDPLATMRAIDGGWMGYRWYFVRKWHRALREKAVAFPDRYDFSSAYRLRSVSALTDFFVRHHTEFRDTAEYLDAYRLTGTALNGTEAVVVAACDDPIIPWAGFAELPASLTVVGVPHGGHCGFVAGARAPSPLDRAALAWFGARLPAPAQTMLRSPSASNSASSRPSTPQSTSRVC